MADLSFIVPARNLSGYIEACLASVTAPMVISSEIIVVDDASADDTALKVQTFAAAHPNANIRLLNTGSMEPKGPGFARNLGLKHATAPRIAFVDGDDWINAAAYANLVILMDRHKADFGWLRAVVFHERKTEFWPFYDEGIRAAVLNGRQLAVTNIEAHPILGGMEPQCCNRVYSSAFLRERVARFPEGIVYEDLPFHFDALFAADRMVLTGETGYFYRTQRQGKITDRNDLSRFDLVRSMAIMNEGVFAEHRHSLAGVHAVSFLAQFALWCAVSVPPVLRTNLVALLGDQFEKLPDEWIAAALQPGALPTDRAFMTWLFLQKDAARLEQVHSRTAEPETQADFMIATHRREPEQVEPEIALGPENRAGTSRLLQRALTRARQWSRP
ncbi:glycosyltransferase family A protein [Devosia sp. 1566]|uniref:glycosyltransferase family 2 protein n=1 Tax=Devosia sp. 1566 TaxID=2499144 RepID=UPI000FD878F1|nr:glycosyltransferase family A protein [Devosia sp. 1566]